MKLIVLFTFHFVTGPTLGTIAVIISIDLLITTSALTFTERSCTRPIKLTFLGMVQKSLMFPNQMIWPFFVVIISSSFRLDNQEKHKNRSYQINNFHVSDLLQIVFIFIWTHQQKTLSNTIDKRLKYKRNNCIRKQSCIIVMVLKCLH